MCYLSRYLGLLRTVVSRGLIERDLRSGRWLHRVESVICEGEALDMYYRKEARRKALYLC
jgi:hypothetical protein